MANMDSKANIKAKSETQVCNWYSCDYGWDTRTRKRGRDDSKG
jgi:hypothetical protein